MLVCLRPCGLQPPRFLCLQDFPGKNSRVDCHALPQGIFPTRDLTVSLMSPSLEGGFFTASANWEALYFTFSICPTLSSTHCVYESVLHICVSAAAAAKSLQSCPTLCDPIDGSPLGSSNPWDSPGKNTGVGCHFLLQCIKVKREREVAQSCPTLRDPMDCSPPDSSDHGIFQARVLEQGAIALSNIYLIFIF